MNVSNPNKARVNKKCLFRRHWSSLRGEKEKTCRRETPLPPLLCYGWVSRVEWRYRSHLTSQHTTDIAMITRNRLLIGLSRRTTLVVYDWITFLLASRANEPEKPVDLQVSLSLVFASTQNTFLLLERTLHGWSLCQILRDDLHDLRQCPVRWIHLSRVSQSVLLCSATRSSLLPGWWGTKLVPLEIRMGSFCLLATLSSDHRIDLTEQCWSISCQSPWHQHSSSTLCRRHGVLSSNRHPSVHEQSFRLAERRHAGESLSLSGSFRPDSFEIDSNSHVHRQFAVPLRTPLSTSLRRLFGEISRRANDHQQDIHRVPSTHLSVVTRCSPNRTWYLQRSIIIRWVFQQRRRTNHRSF